MDTDSAVKRCPACDEEVRAAAIRCKHCHANIKFRQTGILGFMVIGVMMAGAMVFLDVARALLGGR